LRRELVFVGLAAAVMVEDCRPSETEASSEAKSERSQSVSSSGRKRARSKEGALWGKLQKRLEEEPEPVRQWRRGRGLLVPEGRRAYDRALGRRWTPS
jgi:hypothetical protein